MGNFNARTATDTDFVDLIKNRHVDDYITDFVDNFTNVLNDLKMPLNRISMDKSKNKFSNLLLNFCKGNSMFIVNGRVGNDKNIGRFTCRNASVVDYCITSPELLKLFFDFDILESSKLFSDVHAPLHILLSVNLNNNDSNSNTVRKTNHSKAKIKSWENEKVTDFQENIDEEKLHTFEQKLSRWQNEIGVTDQAIIDSLLEDLGNIFTGSAKKTFGTFNCKNIDSKINKNKNGQNQKPWFDQDCKFARQKYRKSKRRYKLNNTIRNRSIMIDDEKGYKKVMYEKYKIYCKKISDDLKNASRDNPKHFSKILGGHKRKQQPNIEIKYLI